MNNLTKIIFQNIEHKLVNKLTISIFLYLQNIKDKFKLITNFNLKINNKRLIVTVIIIYKIFSKRSTNIKSKYIHDYDKILSHFLVY